MAKTTETAPIPAFASVPVADLPAASKATSPAMLALGTAIIGAMSDGNAAQDPTVYADRKAATTAAARMKRAVAAVAKDRAITTRVFSDAAGYHVALLDKPAERGADLAD